MPLNTQRGTRTAPRWRRKNPAQNISGTGAEKPRLQNWRKVRIVAQGPTSKVSLYPESFSFPSLLIYGM